MAKLLFLLYRDLRILVTRPQVLPNLIRFLSALAIQLKLAAQSAAVCRDSLVTVFVELLLQKEFSQIGRGVTGLLPLPALFKFPPNSFFPSPKFII